MKKMRGKKRYFKNLWHKVHSFQLDIEKMNTYGFDFEHWHLDFGGIGNNNIKIRREHIKVHLELYDRITSQLEEQNINYQTWICLHEEDVCGDAVYVHTPHVSDNYFPHKDEGLNWNCKIPSYFKDLIDTQRYKVGYFKNELEEVYFIQSHTYGISL